MVHKFLCLYFAIGISTYSYAQNFNKVNGVVLDAETNEPISSATIALNGRYFILVDAKGKFVLDKLSDKEYTLDISLIGYENLQIQFNPTSKKDNFIIYLKRKSTNLDEVYINKKSTSRQDKELSFVANTVDKDFLDKNRENSLMQTLENIPGVTTMNIGSGQSKPVIRGLGFNRVSVVQNGIKHEAQQWGVDHGLEIDQYGIESIQIIKGPISLLYGSDAIGGVVNIKAPSIPKKNSFSGDVNLLAESNNDLLGISAGIESRKDKWYYRGRLTYRDYGDYKVPTDRINYDSYIFTLHKNHLRNTAGKEANAAFSFGYVSDKIQSETFISNVNSKNGFFANAHGLEVRTSTIDYDKSSRDIDYPFHTVNHFKLTNTTSIHLGDHKLSFDTGFQNNYREEHSEPVPHGYMPKPENSKERAFNKNTLSINATDTFKLFSNHEIVAGINAEYQNNSIGGWGFLIPAYNRFTIGAFVYDKYAINQNLHLHTGLRYDFGSYNTKSHIDWYPSLVEDEFGNTTSEYLQRAQDKKLNYGNFSSSLGLSYINKNTTYKVNIGKSFRMPLANELASDGVNYHMYRFEKGNLSLKPEESYQIDLDIDHSTSRFNIGISPFVNFFDNFIYLNPTPRYFETLQVYEYTQNKVFRIGGEIRAGVKLTDNLSLDASAEYVHSRQTSGPKKHFTLPFSPPLSGLFTASYKLKDLAFIQKPTVVASYKIAAKQDEIVPPESITNGYQLLNMSFFSQMNLFKNNKPLDFRLKVNNIFNTKYFNHTSFYRLISVPEAGRNISISLTQHF